MDKKGQFDKYIAVLFAIAFTIFSVLQNPLFLAILFPIGGITFVVFAFANRERDSYFKSTRQLYFTLLVFAILGIFILLGVEKDFQPFNFSFQQNHYVIYGLFFIATSLFFTWLSKKVIPVSFVRDDDRIVQETMYEDYENKSLGEAFLHRGVLFKDEIGQNLTPDKLHQAKGEIKPIELDISNIESEALNKNNKLKFYYEKLILDMYNAFVKSDFERLKNLETLYGYTLTIKLGINSTSKFKKALEEESFCYSNIFRFIEKDMNDKDIKIRFKKQFFIDNFYCLEFMLISAILVIRQYVNLPIGNLARYVRTQKDENFMGCFSSLPSELSKLTSISVSPSGIAYFYIYYALHLDFFLQNKTEGVLERWVSEL